MRKALIIIATIVVLGIGLFVLTGCGNKEENITNPKTDNSTSTETQEKATFTKEVVKSHVKYKVPEDISLLGGFKDLGHNCYISYYTNQSSVYALYPFDDKVETINKVTINGFNYDTYKYVDNTQIHYVYRTKVNNDYHLFQYDVSSDEYDDSQVEAFMNTIEYVYDSINSQQ